MALIITPMFDAKHTGLNFQRHEAGNSSAVLPPVDGEPRCWSGRCGGTVRQDLKAGPSLAIKFKRRVSARAVSWTVEPARQGARPSAVGERKLRPDIGHCALGDSNTGTLGQSSPDLILTDIQMPVMDGFEMLRQLRLNQTTRDIPVIAISADAHPSAVARGRAAGCVDYRTKPGADAGPARSGAANATTG